MRSREPDARGFTMRGSTSVDFGGSCGVPSNATGVSITITALGSDVEGDYQIYPSGTGAPWISNVNFTPNRDTPNGAVVRLGAGSPDVLVYFNGPYLVPPQGTDPGIKGSAHLAIDINGYFLAR